MTSPYLNKPRRTLDEAESDRARGVGAQGKIPPPGPRAARERRTREGAWYVLGVCALVVGGALAGMIAISEPKLAEDPDPAAVIEIAPAAGSTEAQD